jgi:hypothetical protein
MFHILHSWSKKHIETWYLCIILYYSIILLQFDIVWRWPGWILLNPTAERPRLVIGAVLMHSLSQLNAILWGDGFLPYGMSVSNCFQGPNPSQYAGSNGWIQLESVGYWNYALGISEVNNEGHFNALFRWWSHLFTAVCPAALTLLLAEVQQLKSSTLHLAKNGWLKSVDIAWYWHSVCYSPQNDPVTSSTSDFAFVTNSSAAWEMHQHAPTCTNLPSTLWVSLWASATYYWHWLADPNPT